MKVKILELINDGDIGPSIMLNIEPRILSLEWLSNFEHIDQCVLNTWGLWGVRF